MEEDKDLRKIDCLSDETNKEMNKNRNQLSDRMLKLHDAVAESLLLTDFNIQEKALVSGNIAHGWITTFFAEQATLKRLEDKKDELEAKFIEKYGAKDIPRFQTTSLMEQNKQIKKLNETIYEQSEVVRYLQEVTKILKNSSFEINNVVKIMQLEK